jgi:hypothetical protein
MDTAGVGASAEPDAGHARHRQVDGQQIGLTGFTADRSTTATPTSRSARTSKLALDDLGGSPCWPCATTTQRPGRPRTWRNGPVLTYDLGRSLLITIPAKPGYLKSAVLTTNYAAILTGQPQSLKRMGQTARCGTPDEQRPADQGKAESRRDRVRNGVRRQHRHLQSGDHDRPYDRKASPSHDHFPPQPILTNSAATGSAAHQQRRSWAMCSAT